MTSRDLLNPFRLYNPAKPSGRLLYLWGCYLYPIIILLVVGSCATGVDVILGYSDSLPMLNLSTSLLFFLFVPTTILITIRRLKDLGRSGLTMLFALVPIVGLFFLLWLIFAPGVHQPQTSYGVISSQPPGEDHDQDHPSVDS